MNGNRLLQFGIFLLMGIKLTFLRYKDNLYVQ